MDLISTDQLRLVTLVLWIYGFGQDGIVALRGFDVWIIGFSQYGLVAISGFSGLEFWILLIWINYDQLLEWFGFLDLINMDQLHVALLVWINALI